MDTSNKDTLIKAIPAGIIIGISCISYLSIEDHIVGAFLFVLGLFTIYSLDLYLFTGKVSFLLEHKSFIKMIIIWIGNFIGALFIAILSQNTRLMDNENMVYTLEKYVQIKTNDELMSIFILGIFCGMMMFIAAKCYYTTKDTSNSIGGYLGMILCVMLFILAGFEHSVANMFYFSLNNSWNSTSIIALVVVSLGNAIGGNLIPFILSFLEKKKQISG